MRDWRSENVELRGFAEPIAVRNVANDIPDEAVEALVDVSRENAGLFQRFFRWKAEALGMERLRRYDLYAPIAASAKRRSSTQRPVELTLGTFRAFDGRFAELAERGVRRRRPRRQRAAEGARRGAPSARTVLPSQTPWVLLNYTGTGP